MKFWTDNDVAIIEIIDEGAALRFVRLTHYSGTNDLWTLQSDSDQTWTTAMILEVFDANEITIIATILPELMIPKGEEAKWLNK